MFKIGDKVKVEKRFNKLRRSYRYLPDLAGKIGVISRIQTETTVTFEPLDMPIYWVKFNPFKIGVIPEGGHSTDLPTEWIEQTEFCFCDMLKHV